MKSKFKVGDTVCFNKKAERRYGGKVSNCVFFVYQVIPPNDSYDGYRIRVNTQPPRGTDITKSEEIFKKAKGI